MTLRNDFLGNAEVAYNVRFIVFFSFDEMGKNQAYKDGWRRKSSLLYNAGKSSRRK
jgi:hypothetical protein